MQQPQQTQSRLPESNLQQTTQQLSSKQPHQFHSATMPADHQKTDPPAPASGLVHSVKKSMSGLSHALEPEYETALHRFHNLNTTIQRLKDQINVFIRSVFALNDSQYNLAQTFNSLLAEESNATPYSTLSAEVYNSHRVLLSGRERTATLELAEKVLVQLDEQIVAYSRLHARINQRQTLKQEYDYYLQKIEKLRIQRDKQLTSKKDPSTADTERYERNVNKTRLAEQNFKNFNYQLVSEFNNLWGRRVTVIGPALDNFVKAEQQLDEIQNEVLAGIKTRVNITQANNDFMANYREILPTDSESSSAGLVLAEGSLHRRMDRPGSIYMPENQDFNQNDNSPLLEDALEKNTEVDSVTSHSNVAPVSTNQPLPAVQPTFQPATQPMVQPAVQPVVPTVHPAVQPTSQPLVHSALQPTAPTHEFQKLGIREEAPKEDRIVM